MFSFRLVCAVFIGCLIRPLPAGIADACFFYPFVFLAEGTVGGWAALAVVFGVLMRFHNYINLV